MKIRHLILGLAFGLSLYLGIHKYLNQDDNDYINIKSDSGTSSLKVSVKAKNDLLKDWKEFRDKQASPTSCVYGKLGADSTIIIDSVSSPDLFCDVHNTDLIGVLGFLNKDEIPKPLFQDIMGSILFQHPNLLIAGAVTDTINGIPYIEGMFKFWRSFLPENNYAWPPNRYPSIT